MAKKTSQKKKITKRNSTRRTQSGGRSASATTKKATTKKAGSKKAGTRSGTKGGGGEAAGKHLVIVESPAKARTINKYLGSNYVVKASVGHVRDLPSKASKSIKAITLKPEAGEAIAPGKGFKAGEKVHQQLGDDRTVKGQVIHQDGDLLEVRIAGDSDASDFTATGTKGASELSGESSNVSRAIKSSQTKKTPVPGVDLEHDFTPSYEIIEGKGKNVTELKRAARAAEGVWLATDLDREGEAIAWHLTEALGVSEGYAHRVVFNAITKDEIRRAFEQPRSIDVNKVNAQTARRILDRIVGYQVSPLLWKKVAGGLSAGRVQSVAVELIVDREREIDAFVPEEYWKITGYMTPDTARADELRKAWAEWVAEGAEQNQEKNGKARPGAAARTQKECNAWLNEHQSIAADLVEVRGRKFEPKTAEEALETARLAGFELHRRDEREDPKGKGPAKNRVTLVGELSADQPDWRVKSIETKRTRSRPSPPFITSTLQQTAANQLGSPAAQTMRTAQQLYEGIDLKGVGSVGLITYMRTDSTHISNEALQAARSHIHENFGDRYLPSKPNVYKSSNQSAQEAHEAIRPTDLSLTPDSPAIKSSLDQRQWKLYRLIFNRFLASQMVPAEWDSTTVLVSAKPEGTELGFKCTGRTLVFDGFYRVTGVPNTADELILPKLEENQPLAALGIDPQQKFTNPPPRYTEASLVKTLESEGIGRPSTYAQIIQTIQDRNYVEKLEGRFHATDLGMVVTDKLREAFPRIMDIGYTRWMEDELDAIEQQQHDWVKFLHQFYSPFRENLEQAYEQMQHAKAETEEAPDEYRCPECGSKTMYRFGKKGRFLSCTQYPDCKYAAPVDREGKPVEPEKTDVACPKCGDPMMLRKGRFGPFLSCDRYPDCDGIVNLTKKGHVQPPKVPPLQTDLPCPKCESPLNLRRGARGPWLSCSRFPKCRGRLGWTKLEEDQQQAWEKALAEHEKANRPAPLKTVYGETIGDEHTPRPLHDTEAEAGSGSTSSSGSDREKSSADRAEVA